MKDAEKALRERILWLSFRWQELRDRADFLEWYGHDAGNLRALMFDLQMEIRKLKDELEGIEQPARGSARVLAKSSRYAPSQCSQAQKGSAPAPKGGG